MRRCAYLAVLTAAVSLCSVARADNTPPKSSVQTVAPEDAEAILGRAVVDQSGKEIGRLVDILVDDSGRPQAAVIDFGGFLGVGSRKVAVHWSTMHFNPADGKHKIALDMTPDQIKAAPEYVNGDKPAPVVTPTDASPTDASPPAH
ncbi:PRC-barrel domain-containing protein [Rhodopila sp.]|uniref:PRC-barrel domain-containing protein n=1 Tax=Rhodopila sp. TaxID=2480087 RepID=UPI003D0DD350